MTRTRLLLVVAALLLVPAWSQDAPPPVEEPEEGGIPADLLEVSPEDLAGVDTQAGVAEAFAAYQSHDYPAAARAFISVLKQSPGDSNSLYNLACCFGLMGADEQAARFLEAAYARGFHDLEHVRGDPDFDQVRSSEAFQEAMARLEERDETRLRWAGRALEIPAPVLADVRLIEPDDRNPEQRYPLVVGLHGYGDNGENFARLFAARGLETGFFFCVPQAPYAFSPGERLGYSWTREGEGLPEGAGRQSYRLSREYVLSVIDEVRRQYPIDERRVFLLGFSQGAGLAFSLGLHHPDRFRGVIPIGGWCDPAEYTAAEAEAARTGLFLVCHSPEDRMVPFEAAEGAVHFLAEEDIPHRFLQYEGGHSLPRALMEEVQAWMEDPRPGDVSPTEADDF